MEKLLFISSGGGHLEELLSLRSLFDEFDYLLVTEKTDTTKYLIDKYKNVEYVAYGTKAHLFSYIFVFLFNISKSFIIFLKFKPDYVISTGTHTAVPMIMIAHLFKKKTIWIETMANINTPTKAGGIVYKYVDKFIVQWPEMLEVYPKAECWGTVL